MKWFWAIFLMSQDKGGISSLRLSKLVDVSVPTAWLMLHKIREAMAQRDEHYQLSGYIEFDQGVFGRAATAKNPEKADNQSEVLVMIESKGKQAGFLSMQVIASASRDNMRPIIERKVKPGQSFRSDGLQANYVLKSMGHKLEASPVPPEKICTELPWVHIAISLAKRFILGTYHGVSGKQLQRYLDEFCYRFNRRFFEPQLFSRLLKACVCGEPLTYAATIAT
jgi:transposase-like protein